LRGLCCEAKARIPLLPFGLYILYHIVSVVIPLPSGFLLPLPIPRPLLLLLLIDSFNEGGVLSGGAYVEDYYTTGGISAFGEVHDLIAQPGATGSVLTFSATQGSGSWYVDDISLTGPSTPEPSSGTTTVLAFGALMSFARMTRRAHGSSSRMGAQSVPTQSAS
jgi:hypothetical protein